MTRSCLSSSGSMKDDLCRLVQFVPLRCLSMELSSGLISCVLLNASFFFFVSVLIISFLNAG